MKKNIKLKSIFAFLFFVGIQFSVAQQVNTLYFMDNVAIRHTLNPAFQPITDFYLGAPVLGFTQFGVGNNSLAVSDIIYPDPANPTGPSLLFLNERLNLPVNALDAKNLFYKSLKPTTLIGADVQINLLNFGWRRNTAYWSVGISQKVDVNVLLPKGLFKLLLYGTPETSDVGNEFKLKTLGFDVNVYTEMAVGYSKIIDDNWTFGGKFKFLYGQANANLKFKNFDLNGGVNEWKINGVGAFNYAGPAPIADSLDGVTMPSSAADYISPSGIGAAIDFGATYKLLEELTLSASLVDLGLIGWSKNAKNISGSANLSTSGLAINDMNSLSNLDSIRNDLASSAYDYSITSNSYSTFTKAKLNLGAEYAFLDNKLGVGLLSRTMLYRSTLLQEITASVNARPVNWFNMSLSYSVLNGRASNIGAALGVRTLFLNWFLAADFIPLRVNQDFIPTRTDRVNLAFGVNIVLGYKSDKDRDGVVDKKDKCPNTPEGVIVDIWGCPLDTDNDGVADFLDECPDTPLGALVDTVGCPVDSDGDGVPDYLDLCPETPVEAYGQIDSLGCPLDTDGDGVPNYLDKCPDTPMKAIGFVDSVGCSKDTDGDGVYDYLDECPDTPEGVTVNAVGCPIDTDGDGVPDYLDKCPDTPIVAKGMVDSVGCPLDTDGDGVFDYMDECPDTPIEARKFINKFGCPIDTDGDGVPDYLDKCPDTPIVAKGMVDSVGCPLDTDGDGVPDYRDNCRFVKGVPANNGCPEVKKEVRTLFQKALQGIQFESGKDLIRPQSFPILNQIAKVFIDNPTYIVEIQGHTDNVGKKEYNQNLSENRALSVMNYLIGKGVPQERMTAKGFGDSMPVATNATSAGKAKNRRVQFIVVFEEVKYE